jgi:hypothetical protein
MEERDEPRAALFPRWKECVLLFIGLTALTVFVPQPLGWGVFCLTAYFVIWRGYRDASIPAWKNTIGLGLLSAFVGTLLWSFVAVPLQRNGIVRLSRDIYIAAPEHFLCCIWNGRSKLYISSSQEGEGRAMRRSEGAEP